MTQTSAAASSSAGTTKGKSASGASGSTGTGTGRARKDGRGTKRGREEVSTFLIRILPRQLSVSLCMVDGLAFFLISFLLIFPLILLLTIYTPLQWHCIAFQDESSRKPEMKLTVPEVLKAQLVDDWEAVTKNNQVCSSPDPIYTTPLHAPGFVLGSHFVNGPISIHVHAAYSSSA